MATSGSGVTNQREPLGILRLGPPLGLTQNSTKAITDIRLRPQVMTQHIYFFYSTAALLRPLRPSGGTENFECSVPIKK